MGEPTPVDVVAGAICYVVCPDPHKTGKGFCVEIAEIAVAALTDDTMREHMERVVAEALYEENTGSPAYGNAAQVFHLRAKAAVAAIIDLWRGES